MGSWAERTIEPLLVHPAKSWQPTDLLPDSTSPDFLDQLQAFRAECARISPEVLLVLIGDMVTEEALPSYMSMLNRMDGTKDATGGSPGPWARWNRAWTAEENRHGDLLNKLLYLSGRANMASVENSIQHLIGAGFDPHLSTDAYRCFVYTSFQERATKISHRNSAALAGEHGALSLQRACDAIAGDEARHEAAYQRIVSELLVRDTDATVIAIAGMMRSSIVMPAHLMRDGGRGAGGAAEVGSAEAAAAAGGHASDFFKGFAAVADSLGVYTARDYADVFSFLLKRWGIAGVQVGSGEAAEAQVYLLAQEERLHRLASVHEERTERQRRRGKQPAFQCDWLFGDVVRAL